MSRSEQLKKPHHLIFDHHSLFTRLKETFRLKGRERREYIDPHGKRYRTLAEAKKAMVRYCTSAKVSFQIKCLNTNLVFRGEFLNFGLGSLQVIDAERTRRLVYKNTCCSMLQLVVLTSFLSDHPHSILHTSVKS